MHPLRPQYFKIVTYSVMASIAIAAVAEWVFHSDGKGVYSLMGGINTAISLFWWWFENRGWRVWPFNKIPGLSIPPDLRGRWEGLLKRQGSDEKDHEFVLEITQSYSKIGIVGMSRNSRSNTIIAAVLEDEHKSHYQIVNTWQGKTKNSSDPEKEDEFLGTSIIDVEATPGTMKLDRKLKDYYFTRREPHTRGHITVKWVGLKLYDTFQKK